MPRYLIWRPTRGQARRGWFNIWQPSARWGDQGNPFSAPAGMLGNNVISDPASCSLWFYADQAFWTPEVSPGLSMMPLVRRTLEFWLDDKRMRPTGEVIFMQPHERFGVLPSLKLQQDADAGSGVVGANETRNPGFRIEVRAENDQPLASAGDPAHDIAKIGQVAGRGVLKGLRLGGHAQPL